MMTAVRTPHALGVPLVVRLHVDLCRCMSAYVPMRHIWSVSVSANSASPAETEAGKPSGSGFRLPSIPFWIQIVAGLVLGVLLGWITRSYEIGWLYTTLDQVGHIFVQLLKLAVAP